MPQLRMMKRLESDMNREESTRRIILAYSNPMDELRIPKISAEIVCHTTEQESINGKIFLDMISSSGPTLSQVLEFFNSHELFFPFKLPHGASILFHKRAILRIDVPELFSEYESEVSSQLDVKRDAKIHFTNGILLDGRFIIDMPIDHARSLDFLNSGRRFIPFLLDETLTLIHTDHVYKVEES